VISKYYFQVSFSLTVLSRLC